MLRSVSLCCGVFSNISYCFVVFLCSVSYGFLMLRSVVKCCEVFFSVTYCFLVFLSVS